MEQLASIFLIAGIILLLVSVPDLTVALARRQWDDDVKADAGMALFGALALLTGGILA